MFFIGFQTGGYQLVLLNVADTFGVNNLIMGSLVSVLYIAVIISPLIFASMSDRVGKKKVIIMACLVFVFGCTLITFFMHIVSFVLGIFIIGCGYSLVEGLANAALADAYPEKSSRYFNLVLLMMGGRMIGSLFYRIRRYLLLTGFIGLIVVLIMMAGSGLGGAFAPALLGFFADQYGLMASYLTLSVIACVATGVYGWYLFKIKNRRYNTVGL
jgi:MFS family permease